jgi:hypothetical protein
MKIETSAVVNSPLLMSIYPLLNRQIVSINIENNGICCTKGRAGRIENCFLFKLMYALTSNHSHQIWQVGYKKLLCVSMLFSR